ncbi:ABC transporter ATP-binding protein [Actinacidiphila sp. ITFR-21]|uniref:ABC transporter ATP-binding protein n=1 Tax=Actinacidiphila sp. ITFR-21 TaxID=3075199 RepID=UPI00288A42A6|nr:ABC transporter ATP-binding protein [Streptomyces sp. ITFR-21]WNI18762.1 ABC transporter ATP-binding protein [Streptomyces sp. ITFR-21]
MDTHRVPGGDANSGLRLDSVGVYYAPARGVGRWAVRDISLQVRRGEFVSLVGRSGSGKSTLLKVVAGLIRPSEGTVALGSAQITGPTPSIRYVFQDAAQSLFPWKSVESHIRWGHRHGARGSARRAALDVDESLDQVGLLSARDKHVWELSGGMKQRLAIARALASRPDVLLLDEPFSAIDALSRSQLQDVLLQLWAETGITVLFVTHDVDEAVYLSERVVTVRADGGAGVQRELAVDLPFPRDQLETRESAQFLRLRRDLTAQVMSDGGGDHPPATVRRAKA